MVKDFNPRPVSLEDIKRQELKERRLVVYRTELHFLSAIAPHVGSQIDRLWDALRLGEFRGYGSFDRGTDWDREGGLFPDDYERDPDWHRFCWSRQTVKKISPYANRFEASSIQLSPIYNSVAVTVDMLDPASKYFIIGFHTFGNPPLIDRLNINILGSNLSDLTHIPVRSITGKVA